MKVTYWCGVIVIGLVTLTFAASKGIPPRPFANKYAVHAENNGAAMGATRLSASQLRKALAVDKITSLDLDESCFVVEVGLYPAKDGTLEVSLVGFALRAQGEDSAVKPSSAGAVVAGLPYSVQLDSGGSAGPMVGPRPSLGTGDGGVYHDPVTGMPTRRGAYTPKGTDVGTGIGGSQSQTSASGVRRDLELQMAEKALPEGNTASPVAGYIYFSVEKKEHTRYQLEYTLNGKKVVLPL